MIIIGEKINGSIPAVSKAIAQEEAGATFIDCCASVPEEIEVETLHRMIDRMEYIGVYRDGLFGPIKQ